MLLQGVEGGGVVCGSGGAGGGADSEPTDVLNSSPAFVVLIKALRNLLHLVTIGDEGSKFR